MELVDDILKAKQVKETPKEPIYIYMKTQKCI